MEQNSDCGREKVFLKDCKEGKRVFYHKQKPLRYKLTGSRQSSIVGVNGCQRCVGLGLDVQRLAFEPRSEWMFPSDVPLHRLIRIKSPFIRIHLTGSDGRRSSENTNDVIGE